MASFRFPSPLLKGFWALRIKTCPCFSQFFWISRWMNVWLCYFSRTGQLAHVVDSLIKASLENWAVAGLFIWLPSFPVSGIRRSCDLCLSSAGSSSGSKHHIQKVISKAHCFRLKFSLDNHSFLLKTKFAAAVNNFGCCLLSARSNFGTERETDFAGDDKEFWAKSCMVTIHIINKWHFNIRGESESEMEPFEEGIKLLYGEIFE